MSQLINFENLKSKGAWQAEDRHVCEESDNAQRSLPLVFNNEIKLTLQILTHHPNKRIHAALEIKLWVEI